jgi:hypothetical protein
MDPDPGPAIFVIDLEDANKKLIKKKLFLLVTFLRYIYIILILSKKVKKSQKIVGIKVFLTIFAWWYTGSIPLTNGSGFGSGRPKTFGSGSATLL